ncbi:hypothetical protein AAY473_021092 [Plecturocebus cupreus]
MRESPPGPRCTRPPVVGGGRGRRKGVGPPGCTPDPSNSHPTTPRPCGVQRAALGALGPQPPRHPTLLRVLAVPREAAGCHWRVRQPGSRSLLARARGCCSALRSHRIAARYVREAELLNEPAKNRTHSAAE